METQTEQLSGIKELEESLTDTQKSIPSKYFYDETGSKLFNKITKLEEYYPTRTELMIIKNNIEDITATIGSNFNFIEFGSGSSVKTRLLLKNLKGISKYVPIDISEEHLYKSVEDLDARYPEIRKIPVAADYTEDITLPEILNDGKRRVGFFPGSTIGNFSKHEALSFLYRIKNLLCDGGNLLIGIDLVKDKEVLHAAYNDKKGITAEFNLNILRHLNNEYGFNFDLNCFEHKAIFNSDKNRIEMYLISKYNQVIESNYFDFKLNRGEGILTEYSHKYKIESFGNMIRDIFNIEKVWTDEDKYFGILYLSCK